MQYYGIGRYDIAYAVHDFEDAIVVGLVCQEQWQPTLQQLQQCRADWIRDNIVALTDALFSDQHYLRKCDRFIGQLCITHIRWRENEQFNEPLLRFNAELPPKQWKY